MTPEYTLYLNRNYFDTLASAEAFGDRPEPHRRHEKSLWTIYQLLKLGEHELLITDPARQPVLNTRAAPVLQQWIAATYPDFVAQLAASRCIPGIPIPRMRYRPRATRAAGVAGLFGKVFDKGLAIWSPCFHVGSGNKRYLLSANTVMPSYL